MGRGRGLASPQPSLGRREGSSKVILVPFGRDGDCIQARTLLTRSHHASSGYRADNPLALVTWLDGAVRQPFHHITNLGSKRRRNRGRRSWSACVDAVHAFAASRPAIVSPVS
jgi:hypothetical protein